VAYFRFNKFIGIFPDVVNEELGFLVAYIIADIGMDKDKCLHEVMRGNSVKHHIIGFGGVFNGAFNSFMDNVMAVGVRYG